MGLCSSTVATLMTSFGFWKSRAYLALETDTDFQLFDLFSNFLFIVQTFACSTITEYWLLIFQYIFKLLLWLFDWKCTPTLLVSRTQKKFNVLYVQYNLVTIDWTYNPLSKLCLLLEATIFIIWIPISSCVLQISLCLGVWILSNESTPS